MTTTAVLRVLVINAKSSIRRLLRKGLSAKRYQLLETTDAATALELLSRWPDLVILDFSLADSGRNELLRLIRSPNNYIEIVGLLDRDDGTDRVRTLDLGPNGYVTNPFGLEDLLARVRAALRHESKIIHGKRSIFCGVEPLPAP